VKADSVILGTPLTCAIRSRSHKSVQQLISTWAGFDLADELYGAAHNGDPRFVSALLEVIHKVMTHDDAQDAYLRAWYPAVAQGHLKVLKLLLRIADPPPTQRPRYMKSLREKAARRGHKDVLQLLLEYADGASGCQDDSLSLQQCQQKMCK
jgi:hypothetical protein